MALLASGARLDQLGSVAAPLLLTSHALGGKTRNAKTSLRPRHPRQKTNINSAVYDTNNDMYRVDDDSFLSSLEVETENHLVAMNPETLFNETFTQTLYVDRDGAGLKDEVPAAPLRLAEVVTEPLITSLVHNPPPVDKHTQTKRILGEISAISLPALATLMTDPLMSVVDTAFVGQISAVFLASLGPNTAIFHMLTTVMNVFTASVANCLASNSIYAPGLSTQERARRREENETVLCHSLVMAVGIGLALTGVLLAFGPLLLHGMGASPQVMKPALHYLYVRAIAVPAAAFMHVSQGACLGQQDMFTPMKVMLTAGVINFLGDVVFMSFLGWGIAGIACATAVSQIAGTSYYFYYLRKSGKNGKAVELKWKGLPRYSILKPILDMARILVPRSIVLMTGYTGMTAVATAMGTVTLAAHQVALQLYQCVGTVGDAISLTAQSLLARDRNEKHKIRELSRVLLGIGAVVGLTLAVGFGCTLTFFPHCFTSDCEVIAAFQSIIPHGMLSICLYALSITFEGICIGMNQIEKLPAVIFQSTAVTIFCLWVVKRLRLGLNGVWIAAIIFFASRATLHLLNVIQDWYRMPFSDWDPSSGWEMQLASS